MMLRKYSIGIQAFALVAALFFSSCDPEKDDVKTDPPIDGDPQATLISPASGYALARRGETVTIQFEIHDNELLTTWEATEKWTSVSGVVYKPVTRITGQYAAISAQNSIRTIQYTVDPSSSVQTYTTIEIVGCGTDNKGKQACAKFRINVIPDDNSTTAYSIQEYLTGDTVWCRSTPEDYAFDLINRQHGTNQTMTVPNMYLREVSQSPNTDFVFESPVWGNTDSVLVTTNESMFNFDEATYETMWQAFVTSNRIGRRTAQLQPGDVVILKLPNLPHFAAIRVINLSASLGRMTFNYKYSHQ